MMAAGVSAPKQLVFAVMWGLGDKWGFDRDALRREWPVVSCALLS